MFSFVDKLFTQLNNVVVGLLMVGIGFGQMYPTTATPLTPALFWAGMFCLCGLPALAWIVNIICMRFYPLNSVRMAEIQRQIAERKLEGGAYEGNNGDGRNARNTRDGDGRGSDSDGNDSDGSDSSGGKA
jgi:Na+/melibiose symporter-like transporter